MKNVNGYWMQPMKWIMGLAGTIAALVLAAYGYQSARSARLANTLTLPGKMVTTEVGTIYVNCLGNPENPAIVFENGMGLASENWYWVQQLSEST
ncbi:MAG: hypothetical protein AAF986_00235 [Pseudomonadota bacterium]